MKKIKYIIIFLIIVLFVVKFDNVKTEILKIIYKIEFSEYVEKYSREYNVDKYLIYAIIKAESNFKKDAKSNKGANGLMQLMYTTAEEIAEKIPIEVNENNIFDPDININLGTKYISMLIPKYQNISLALAAYNAGSGNVDKWISEGTIEKDGSNVENIPFVETNNYVRIILRDYDIYKELYE